MCGTKGYLKQRRRRRFTTKMTTLKVLGAFALCLVVASAASVNVDTNTIQDSEGYGFEECLRKDSISCVQHQVYRHLRSFFDQKSVELPGGFSLVKEGEVARDGRSAEEVLPQGAVEDREEALETFAVQKATEFFSERSLRWNVAPIVSDVSASARALMDYVPAELKAKVTNFMTEGRGKKKKIIRALIPVLLAAKMKIVGFLGLAYVIIALIAKKAILASLVSLAISGFIALRKLLGNQSHGHEVKEVHAEYAPHGWSGGYSSGGWDGGDAHGSYSSPVAHALAYNGQKPISRR